jgi:CRISPR system Cascade subunit CasE
MSWLARLDVSAETVRSQGISDDIYAWHKMLWECYPEAPDSKRDFLTRIDELEGAYRLWVMAKRKPVCPPWCTSDGFALKEISPSFLSHRYYAFDLRANPTKCIVRRDPNGEVLLQKGSDGEILHRSDGKPRRRHGKRLPLVKPDELRAWLARKAEVRCTDGGKDIPGGFRILEEKPLEIRPMVESHFRKKGQSGYHGGVQFRGILEVTDRENFTRTYESGIGSAKSFGFGLFLLAPAKI